MLRAVPLRFVFAVLTLLAASMDTATKVLHGIEHEHEARSHALSFASEAGTIPDAEALHVAVVSLDAADDDGHGHTILHGAADARLLRVPLAVPAFAPVLPTSRPAHADDRFIASTDETPASDRAGPRQSRAPPIV